MLITRVNRKASSTMAIAALLLVVSASTAAGNDFMVDSFIPEKFTDLEWRVAGGFNLSGNDNSYNRMLDPGDNRTRYKTANSGDSWQFDVDSYTDYRYETIPKFMELDLRVSGSYLDRSSENSSENAYSSGTHYDSSRDEYDSKQRSLSVSPMFDGGIYVDDDFFLSAMGTAGLSYTEMPDDSRHSEDTDGYLIYSNEIQTDYNRSEEDSYGDTKSHSVSLAIMPGWGRIYEGMYAATALYMIDELRDKGLLLSEPSFEQMSALTELVYQYKLKHAIDHRLHKIEAIEVISEFLVSEGLAVESGSRRDLVLMDVWSYFPKLSREFGMRLRGGFGVLYQYQSAQSTRDHTSIYYYVRTDSETGEELSRTDPDTSISTTNDYEKSTATLPYLVARLEYRNPIDVQTQFDGNIEARYYTGAKSESASRYDFTAESYSYLTDATREVDLKSFYSIQCSGTAHYILNSRTYGSLRANLGYGRFDREVTEHYLVRSGYDGSIATTSEDLKYDGASFDQWNYSVDLSITYRIAIPTTLSFSAGYSVQPVADEMFSARYPYSNMWYVFIPYNDYWRYNHYSEKRYNLRAWISHYIF